MNRRTLWLIGTLCASHAWAGTAAFDQGVQLYKQHQWRDALGQFLAALDDNPHDIQAKRYIDAISKEIRFEQEKTVEEERLRYMGLTGQDPEENRENSKWQRWLEEARMHRDLGHLLPANDLVLRILSENANHTDALRELSELQTRLRDALDRGSNLLIEERYACEGFYAYGQANYPAALTAWEKARLVVMQSAGTNPSAKRIQALHFQRYEDHAKATLGQEKKALELKTAFESALSLYKRERFEEALYGFRKLAIREPEYPQLAYYLVQSESGAEKNRAKRLGERKRQELDAVFQIALKHFESERYAEAEKSFLRVLALDASYGRAQAYLAIAKSENQKRHDPKAAQLHYESGLVAYASGKLDEAQREWSITLRMNPAHEKARVALSKVQKELVLSKEML